MKLIELNGSKALVCEAEGPTLRSDRDAVDLIAEALGLGATMILIPAERLDPDFFELRTGVAGAMIQKFVIYRRRLVIIGDFSSVVTKSVSFRDFVREANRGADVWFVADQAELKQRLQGQ